MAIPYGQVPAGIRTPGRYTEIDNTGAVRALLGMPSKILVFAQMLDTGTAEPGVPIRALNVNEAEAAGGRGSMAHLMFRLLKLANKTTDAWMILLEDDPEGTAATGAVKFGGAVAAAGTLNLYITPYYDATGLKGRIRVGVTSSDTPASIATKVAAAITAQTDLPVTAEVNDEDDTQVDLAARHKGECGNDISIDVNYYQGETLPAGVTVTITAMTGGAGNPDIGDALLAMADDWYTDIAMPYMDAANMTALENELAYRFGPMSQMDGHAYAAHVGSHSALSTLGNSRNSPHTSIMGTKASPTAGWIAAASLCGVCAFQAKQDPGAPIQELVWPGVLPPKTGDTFPQEDRNILLYDGIATAKLDGTGTKLIIERVITTYQKNNAGVEDPSYLDVETMKTLAYMRYTYNAYYALNYPQHKLGGNGNNFGSGQKVMTPKLADAETVVIARQWEEAALLENADQFIADLLSERDATDVDRLNQLLKPDVINQFRVLAGKIQFIL